jgi:glycosyltransferase involved in cell wall biosynthesis
VDEGKLAVTHEGVSPLFFGATPLADSVLAAMGIRPPFVVAVGTLEPRKNLKRLLEAWRATRSELPDWMLVLAGPKGWGPKLPPAEGVAFTGFLADETLPGLLAAAEVLCYPSLYEGFGLPPLEAMAAGTPALVGRYAAAEEVTGDAAVLVDPRDTAEIAAGLHRLALNEKLRMRLTVAGKARAAAFTWEATARSTLKVYYEVTKGT